MKYRAPRISPFHHFTRLALPAWGFKVPSRASACMSGVWRHLPGWRLGHCILRCWCTRQLVERHWWHRRRHHGGPRRWLPCSCCASPGICHSLPFALRRFRILPNGVPLQARTIHRLVCKGFIGTRSKHSGRQQRSVESAQQPGYTCPGRQGNNGYQ